MQQHGLRPHQAGGAPGCEHIMWTTHFVHADQILTTSASALTSNVKAYAQHQMLKSRVRRLLSGKSPFYPTYSASGLTRVHKRVCGRIYPSEEHLMLYRWRWFQRAAGCHRLIDWDISIHPSADTLRWLVFFCWQTLSQKRIAFHSFCSGGAAACSVTTYIRLAFPVEMSFSSPIDLSTSLVSSWINYARQPCLATKQTLPNSAVLITVCSKT